MSAIGKAIGPLVNIALLLLFAIIIFAIIGLEFYSGALNTTCYNLNDLGISGRGAILKWKLLFMCLQTRFTWTATGTPVLATPRSTRLTPPWGPTPARRIRPYAWRSGMHVKLRVKTAQHFLSREGPNFGITSFDNILVAMLTVFQCVTMEGWTTIMYWVGRGGSNE